MTFDFQIKEEVKLDTGSGWLGPMEVEIRNHSKPLLFLHRWPDREAVVSKTMIWEFESLTVR